MAAPLTVPDLLAIRAAEDPHAVAMLVDGHDGLTFGDWLLRAEAAARGLAARGVGPGDRVGLVFDSADWPQYAVAYCAVQLAGAVAVPLSAGRAVGDLQDVLRQSRAVAVLHGTSAAPPRGLPETVAWSAEASDVAGDGTSVTPQRTAPSDLAQILFTSGTTGTPKGVGASHANLTAGFAIRAAQRPLAHSRHAVHAFPIGTNAGQTMLLNALTARPAVVAMARFDAARLCTLVRTLRAGSVFLVPAMAIDLLRSGALASADLASVRLVGCTGAALPAAVATGLAAALPHATVVNYYTSTEAAPAQTTMVFDPRRPSSLGRPAIPGDIMIRAEDGTDAPAGQAGQVWLRSPSPRHYVDDPASTAAVFAGGWVRMGDVGFLDADGYLHLVDRESDVIVTGAHKVSSLHVEDALHTHPDVIEAAVLAVEHPMMGATVGAVIASNTPIGIADLRAFLSARLARHELPTHVAVVDRLPRNDGGKVRKRELAALLARTSASQAAVESTPAGRELTPAPVPAAVAETPTEKRLAVIWGRVLRTGMDKGEDFFALGGDSLRAAQIAELAEQTWRVGVSADDVLARPTLRDLADWIDRQAATGRPAAPGGEAEAAEPTALQRVWLAERAEDPPRSVVPIHIALRIDEPFDHAILERCLAQLVERHDALRTPLGHPPGSPVLSTERRTAPTVTRAIEDATAFITDGSVTPLRALTSTIKPDRHLLVLAIDHLHCDGWSVGIILRELGLLYSAMRNGASGPLRPVAATAADAARWAQDQWPGSNDYWRDLLATPVADPAPLAGQRVRPGSYEGASHSFTLGPQLVRELRATAQASRSTLMRVTLAAWAAALREQTGSAEFAFMSPLTGRIRPEWEQVVGCLIQQPIIRVRVGDDPAPGELLDRVHRRTADATEHQFYAFHEFTGRVAHPAYFFYEPWARPAHLPGLVSSQATLPPELGLRWALRSGYADLSPPRLRLIERTGDVLQGQLVYNRHAVDPAVIRALATAFVRACTAYSPSSLLRSP